VAGAAAVRRAAERIWAGTANPDGFGLLERGTEFDPTPTEAFDPLVVNALVRLARLSESVVELLRDCPETEVRRSAAVLAARAYPIRATFDGG
jgi:hypothetical protein